MVFHKDAPENENQKQSEPQTVLTASASESFRTASAVACPSYVVTGVPLAAMTSVHARFVNGSEPVVAARTCK